MNDPDVIITDCTLREYGQNVPAPYLHIFTPEIRAEIARRLITAGVKRIEVFSCVKPEIAPSMNETEMRSIAQTLGKTEGTELITLVPNKAGFETFLRLDLGPDGYRHTLGFFFSVVESHNRVNLGKTIEDTISEYKIVAAEAALRNIPMVGYLSAVFGYFDPPSRKLIKADLKKVNAYIDLYFDLGATAVTLSDLQGVADRRETIEVLETILNYRKGKDLLRMGYHPHHMSEDQALSNSQAAYDLGIRNFDASLGRAGGCVTGAPGNQPTEQLVRKFAQSGIETGIDADKMNLLTEYIKKELYANIPIIKEIF